MTPSQILIVPTFIGIYYILSLSQLLVFAIARAFSVFAIFLTSFHNDVELEQEDSCNRPEQSHRRYLQKRRQEQFKQGWHPLPQEVRMILQI